MHLQGFPDSFTTGVPGSCRYMGTQLEGYQLFCKTVALANLRVYNWQQTSTVEDRQAPATDKVVPVPSRSPQGPKSEGGQRGIFL